MDIAKAIKILKIETFTSSQDIKNSFYKVAHLYHPDKNKDSQASMQFRLALQAYEYCLNHIDQVYIFFGTKDKKQEDQAIDSNVVIQNVNDIFEDIFGFSKSGRILGFHTPEVVYLTVDQFCHGATLTKKIGAFIRCQKCEGMGVANGAKATICRYCFGQGTIYKKHHHKKVKVLCSQCEGRGRTIKEYCEQCEGYGRIKKNHKQKFHLPVGMCPFESFSLESYDLTLKKQAQIFIEPRLLRDKIFQIENYNLLCQYHADSKRKEKDFTIQLKTPFGLQKVFVPSHTKSHDTIQVKHAGLYKDSSKRERGDLIVKVLFKKRSLLKRIFGGST